MIRSLIGETAEMPGVYKTEEYDIAGFVVGVVERNQILPKESTICPGDVLIGLHSSGIHSNGFSLVRRIIDDNGLSYHDTCPFDDTKTLGEALLTPTKIYVKSLLPLMREGKVKAFAHITGIFHSTTIHENNCYEINSKQTTNVALILNNFFGVMGFNDVNFWCQTRVYMQTFL